MRNVGRSQRDLRRRSWALGSIRAAAVSHRPHDSHDSHDSARLPINVARNFHVNFLNFEIGSLIFHGFQDVIQDTLRGITCEMWEGTSAGPAGSTVSTGSRQRSCCPVADSSPHPQWHPKRRPPLLKPSEYSHRGRGGLHFGQIAGEEQSLQHAAVADTTLTTESTTPHPSARSSCQHHGGNRRLTSG